MRGRGLVAGVVALAGVLVAAQSQAPPAQQPPAFRATTDVVTVDVSVRSGDTPVTGLTAGDFLLLDNGVKQQIESVDVARLPLDISLVVDVSGGSPKWWGTPRPAAEIASRLNEIVRKATAVLRPEDRLRLVTIDTHADEVVPLASPGGAVSLTARLATNGLSSLHDALVATLLQPMEPNRRHLIVAVTKGDDTVSAADATAVRDVAQRSDAVLHVVLGHSQVGDVACEFGCGFPRRRFWQPFQRASVPFLAPWAESTGGRFHDASLLGFRDFADEFKRVFDEYRQGYVLRYRPQGVKREGWHEVAVSVPVQPKLVVRARRGYAIEAAAPPAAPKRAVPGSLPSGLAPETVQWLADMYELGDYTAFVAGLQHLTDLAKVIRDFRAAGNPWPAAPRRDAVFGLEIAIAGLLREGNARREGMALLSEYATLIRHPFSADGFECAWYWTALAGIEGLIAPAVGKPFVARALERCPDQPRFRLAEALFADQQWPAGTLGTVPGQRLVVSPTPEQRREVFALYERAAKLPETATEAGMRAAWFALRLGESARALTLIEAGPAAVGDPPLQYLRELIRGQILRSQNRLDAAAEAYRAALRVLPAQSARVGLMTTLLAAGNRREAEALAEAVQTAPDAEFDPWWMYWQGDFRAYPAILGRLREIAK